MDPTVTVALVPGNTSRDNSCSMSIAHNNRAHNNNNELCETTDSQINMYHVDYLLNTGDDVICDDESDGKNIVLAIEKSI